MRDTAEAVLRRGQISLRKGKIMKKNGMKMTAAAFAALMAVSVGAVVVSADGTYENTPLQIGSMSQYLSEWDDDLEMEISRCVYPQVFVGESDREAYANLDAALTAWNEEMESSTEAYNLEAVQLAREAAASSDSFAGYTSTENLYIERADQHVLSMLSSKDVYSGGPHPSTAYQTWNIDPATGETLKLSDVCTDVDSLMALLQEKVTEKYPETAEFTEVWDTLEPEELHWSAGYYGISFYFGHYELGAYAIGTQNILIPYSGNEALFNADYLDVPEEFAFEMFSTEQEVCDADGDGSYEAVSLTPSNDGYGSYDGMTVTFGGSSLDLDDYFYSYRSAIVCANGGQTYLYLMERGESDYSTIAVIALSESGVPEEVSTFEGSMHYEENGDRWFSEVLTDPADFDIDIKTAMLSTVSGCRSCYVGEKGLPVSREAGDWYRINSGITLTLLKDLEMTIVDEAGSEQGTETFPAGTEFTMSRTDNSEWVDLSVSDGRLARVYIDSQTWPRTIDGTDIEEVFDGMIFAG